MGQLLYVLGTTLNCLVLAKVDVKLLLDVNKKNWFARMPRAQRAKLGTVAAERRELRRYTHRHLKFPILKTEKLPFWAK